MEKLSNNIAEKIAYELKLDKDRKDIIAYGTFALLQTALSILLVVIFGIIFNVLIEALILSFVSSILRKYSGGAHASSAGRCLIIGTVVCIGQAVIAFQVLSPFINIGLLISMGIIVFILSYYLVYKLAPVDSLAKPIRKEEKKYRMKKGSIFILNTYLAIVVFNIFLYSYSGDVRFGIFSLCIYLGIVWQVFTLTKGGHILMNKIDVFLNQILIYKRGRE
jgi:accessory gene regulator B